MGECKSLNAISLTEGVLCFVLAECVCGCALRCLQELETRSQYHEGCIPLLADAAVVKMCKSSEA